jgi:hypothetical protein
VATENVTRMHVIPGLNALVPRARLHRKTPRRVRASEPGSCREQAPPRTIGPTTAVRHRAATDSESDLAHCTLALSGLVLLAGARHLRSHRPDKRSPIEGLYFVWRRGRDCLRACGAQLPTCRCAAALVEQGSHPQPHSARNKNGATRARRSLTNPVILAGFVFFWGYSGRK